MVALQLSYRNGHENLVGILWFLEALVKRTVTTCSLLFFFFLQAGNQALYETCVQVTSQACLILLI